MALIKIDVPPEMRPALLKEADIFRARVVDASPSSYTIEVTGAGEKLDALISLLHNYGDVQMIRSGAMAMSRSPMTKSHEAFMEITGRNGDTKGVLKA